MREKKSALERKKRWKVREREREIKSEVQTARVRETERLSETE